MAVSEDLAPADLRHGLTLLLNSDGGEQLLATYPDLEDDDYDVTTLPTHVKNMVVNILARTHPDFELPPTYYTALQKRQSLAFARAAEVQNQALDLEAGVQDQVETQVQVQVQARGLDSGVQDHVEAQAQGQVQAQPVTSPAAVRIFHRLNIVDPSGEHANEAGIYGVSEITDYEVYLRDLQRGQRPVRVRARVSRVSQYGTQRSWGFYTILAISALVLFIFGLGAIAVSHMSQSAANYNSTTEPDGVNANPADNLMDPGNAINGVKARAEMVNTVLQVSGEEIHSGLQEAGKLLSDGEWEELDAYLKRVLAQQDGHLSKLEEMKDELDEEHPV